MIAKIFCIGLALLAGAMFPPAAVRAAAPKVLVAYFSRAGENYHVGYIRKGNTEIVAEMIAQKTGGDLFHIESVSGYPAGYEDAKTVARAERKSGARPALTNTVPDFASYDVIYLGYPIWSANMPMPVYTFLESYDFSGKTVIPFCTHEGSGLTSTPDKIRAAIPTANVLPGLAIRGTTAQQDRAETERMVDEFLKQ